MMEAADAASRPEVGSSRKRTDGSLAMAIASDSLRFCPPESPPAPPPSPPPTRVSAHEVSPTDFMRKLTCSSTLSLSVAYSSAAILTCSLAVRKGHRESVCRTYAQCSMYTGAVIAWPLSVTLPTGLPPTFSQVSMLSRVVFPAPLGPMMASTEPERTEAEMSLMRALSWLVAYGQMPLCVLTV